jgi:hypothetical protein
MDPLTKKRKRLTELYGEAYSSTSVTTSGATLPTSSALPVLVVRPGSTKKPPIFAASKMEPSSTPSIASSHPFQTDPHDHAETPFSAYVDIEPFLFGIALQMKSNKARLRLWDPYYCEGSVLKHLDRLGFANVRNDNVDFYATIAEDHTPPFDVLITNPPFSGDHMERFLTYVAGISQPWLALMPQFVAQKRYFHAFKAAAAEAGRELPVYIGPSRTAYAFTAPATASDGATLLVPDAPEGRRTLDSDGGSVRVFAGKFQCVWFGCLGPHREAVLAWWRKKYEGRPGVTASLAEDDPVAQLPQLVLVKPPAPSERRWRKKLSRLHQQKVKHDGDGRGGM